MPTSETVAAARRFFRGQRCGHRAAQALAQRIAGAQGQDRRPAPGRALAFADDPAWAEILEPLGQRDAAAPAEVLDGLVGVLRRWSGSWERPVAVVPMPSRRFPQLVGSVAEHLSQVGRLPLVEALEVVGLPPSAAVSSAVRVRDLMARMTCGRVPAWTDPCCWWTT